MRPLHLATIVSVAIHAALIAGLVWGMPFFRSAPSGGGGGIDAGGGFVSVWVAGPSGEGVGVPVPVARPVREKTAVSAGAAEPQPEKVSASAAPPAGTGGGTGTGDGSGIGSGSGPGVGSGSGGSSVLAGIWRRINGAKYYPQIAKREKLEGSPRVTFSINEDGSIKAVNLAASCGEAILDEAALTTVKRAAPLPYYPGPITLAVKYSLKD